MGGKTIANNRLADENVFAQNVDTPDAVFLREGGKGQ